MSSNNDPTGNFLIQTNTKKNETRQECQLNHQIFAKYTYKFVKCERQKGDWPLNIRQNERQRHTVKQQKIDGWSVLI